MAPPSVRGQDPPGDIFGETVRITVGEEPSARTFTAHKIMLRFYSSYFEGALKEHFIEGQSGHVKLPTEDPEIFDMFLKWLYFHRFQDQPPKTMSGLVRPCRMLMRLWIFADAHGIPLLQNEAIDALHMNSTKHFGVSLVAFTPETLASMYEHTSSNAQLRRYCIKLLSAHQTTKIYRDEHVAKWPNEALVDVVNEVWAFDRKWPTYEDIRRWDMCAFHVHEEGVKCSSVGN